MQLAYAVSLTPEEGEFIVQCRDLPELLTSGKDRAEALAMAEDAMAVVLLTYLEEGAAMPTPSAPTEGEVLVRPPVATAAKLAVVQAFREAGISPSELARRMGVARNEAVRVLDPNHNTKIERLDEAARVLGQRLVVSVEAA